MLPKTSQTFGLHPTRVAAIPCCAQLLFHCFGLRSASVYENDLHGKKDLEEYVGHMEYSSDGKIKFPPGVVPLIKTHEYPTDEKRAIYVVRDGRNVCMSMYHFYKKEVSLEKIICGKQVFGTWSAHLKAWHPWDRTNTLLLKYEDLVKDQEAVLQELSSFLQRDILAHKIPSREKIAGIDGRWVRGKEASRELPKEYLGLFDLVNGEMMRRMGYNS